MKHEASHTGSITPWTWITQTEGRSKSYVMYDDEGNAVDIVEQDLDSNYDVVGWSAYYEPSGGFSSSSIRHILGLPSVFMTGVEANNFPPMTDLAATKQNAAEYLQSMSSEAMNPSRMYSYVTDQAESILFFQLVHPETGEVWGDGIPLGDIDKAAVDNASEYAHYGITRTTDKLVPEICAYSHPPGGPLPAELLERWNEVWEEAYQETLRDIEIQEYEEQSRWR